MCCAARMRSTASIAAQVGKEEAAKWLKCGSESRLSCGLGLYYPGHRANRGVQVVVSGGHTQPAASAPLRADLKHRPDGIRLTADGVVPLDLVEAALGPAGKAYLRPGATVGTDGSLKRNSKDKQSYKVQMIAGEGRKELTFSIAGQG